MWLHNDLNESFSWLQVGIQHTGSLQDQCAVERPLRVVIGIDVMTGGQGRRKLGELFFQGWCDVNQCQDIFLGRDTQRQEASWCLHAVAPFHHMAVLAGGRPGVLFMSLDAPDDAVFRRSVDLPLRMIEAHMAVGAGASSRRAGR